VQDAPGKAELTDAVSHFLQHEVAPTIGDPRLRFRVLIAANLMSIVTRELLAGDAPLLREWQALAALLDRSESTPQNEATLRTVNESMLRELCARIRRGDADDGSWAAAVQRYAHDSVFAKLAIANPRFLERIGASEE
jgi:hypothetical protein